MELDSSDIRNEYIEDFIEQDSRQTAPVLTRGFLDTFLSIITQAEKNPQTFPISLFDSCRLLGMHKHCLQRVIDPQYSRRQNKDTGFIEGVDFQRSLPIKNIHGGKEKKDLFLTVTCFKEAMMQYLGKQGKQSRRYFSITDDITRDTMGEQLRQTVSTDDAITIKQKREDLRSLKSFPKQPYNYAYSFHNGDHDFLYHGITNDPYTRLSRHSKKIQGPMKIHHIEHDDSFDPRELEVCEDHYLSSWKVPIPYQSKGSRSVQYNDDKRIFDVVHQSCVKHLRELNDKVIKDMKVSGITVPPTPVAVTNLTDYPFRLVPRQRDPCWLDYAAADYSFYPPKVVLLNPSLQEQRAKEMTKV